MRTNLPVTQNEVMLNDSTLIVSKTDLKGRITYINKDFLEISGFTEAELIGEPHNIVRHPDMPVEAFEDLWRTLKEGRPWTGYVKNRCKNGDYYWVLANAAPITENGQVTGYMSVRRKVDPATITQVEALYRQFREKKQGSLQIRYGQAVTPGVFSGLKNISVGGKLWSAIGAVVLVSILATGGALLGMRHVSSEMNRLIDQTLTLKSIYSEMYTQGLQTASALRGIILNHEDKQAARNLPKGQADFNAELAKARAIPHGDAAIDAELARIAEASARHMKVQTRVAELAASGDIDAARAMLWNEEAKIWREYKDVMIKGRATLEQKATAARAAVAANAARTEQLAILVSVLALLAAAFAAVSLSRSIRRPMQEMDDTFANVVQGNYSNVIDITRNDEIGRAMQGLQILQTRMGFELSETKRQAEEMARIQVGLYSSTAAISISNQHGILIHATPMAMTLLKTISGMQESELIGCKPTETFLTDPKVQSELNDAVISGHDVDVQLCGRYLRLSARPIKDAEGQTLGRVTTWRDRTAEVTVEKEVEVIIAAASNGDFTQRLALEGKEGFFRNLAEGLNQLLETSAKGLADVADVLNALARGDLTQTITGDYQGTFGQLKDDTNTTVARLREVVGRIKEATEAINTAAKEIAAGNQDLSSRTEEQASSLEETASSMEELNATVKQNAESARQANELASTSNEIATRGGQMVKQVVDTMTGIQASSQKIADIVGVIDSIAFQTNILALNAAVEAARAGEQGRGFAVVASEVRNLAQRSATAAKEIKQLISESVDKVESGAQLVNEAGSTMDEVVASFQQVARLVMDITNASREQSSGIEQVTQAVSQMDEVTQQNAALVEEAAAAAESLEEQAQGLVQAVGMFKLEQGSTLPGPALRDATPRQLGGEKVGAGGTARIPAPKGMGKAIPPPHLSDDDEQWEEF